MDPVVHFEFPAEDRKRISKFYKNAFGWKTEQLGKKNGNYVLATTTKTDKTGRPKEPGSINGGFYSKKEDMPSQFPSVVIGVEDIEKAMKKVRKSGGKVLGEPMEIPGYGSYVSFLDTEGNRISMMEPTTEMKKKVPKQVKKKKK
jgi:uncharacterized protein